MHQLVVTAAFWHGVVADCPDQVWVGVGSSTRAPVVPPTCTCMEYQTLLSWANQSTRQPASTSCQWTHRGVLLPVLSLQLSNLPLRILPRWAGRIQPVLGHRRKSMRSPLPTNLRRIGKVGWAIVITAQDGVRLPPAPISPIVHRLALLRGLAKEILHGMLSMPHM